jgi:hypothetical protein
VVNAQDGDRRNPRAFWCIHVSCILVYTCTMHTYETHTSTLHVHPCISSQPRPPSRPPDIANNLPRPLASLLCVVIDIFRKRSRPVDHLIEFWIPLDRILSRILLTHPVHATLLVTLYSAACAASRKTPHLLFHSESTSLVLFQGVAVQALRSSTLSSVVVRLLHRAQIPPPSQMPPARPPPPPVAKTVIQSLFDVP